MNVRGTLAHARSVRRRIPQLATLVLLAACAGPATRPPAVAPAAVVTTDAAGLLADLRRAAPKGAALLHIDPARSHAQALVFRAGPLARRGHNHVVVAGPGALHGAVLLPAGDAMHHARAELLLELGALQVDPPAAREALGGAFGGALPQPARQGTRDNMLGAAVLDAARFPQLRVSARVLAGEMPGLLLQVDTTLHGIVVRQQVPVRVQQHDGGLRTRGTLVLRQADFGIAPFRAAGGLLQVADH